MTDCDYLGCGLDVISGNSLEFDCVSQVRAALYFKRGKIEGPKCNCLNPVNCRYKTIEQALIDEDIRIQGANKTQQEKIALDKRLEGLASKSSVVFFN